MPRTSRSISRPPALLALVAACCCCAGALWAPAAVEAQEKTVASPAEPVVRASPGSDLERSGLIGRVRRVRTETAKLFLKAGKLVEGARTPLETATYDLTGVKVDGSYFKAAGASFTGREEYKYDKMGNITEMALRNDQGYLVSKELYTYEFDAIGNWTKMTTAVAVVEGGKPSLEPIEVTYRLITYYLDDVSAKFFLPAPASPAPSRASEPAQGEPAAQVEGKGAAVAGEPTGTDSSERRRPAVLTPSADEPEALAKAGEREEPRAAAVAGPAGEEAGDSHNNAATPASKASAYRQKAATYFERGLHREAVEAYLAAFQLAPGSAVDYYRLGNSYAALQRHGEAVAALKMVLQLDPQMTGAQYDLGQELSALKSFSEATKIYERLVKLNPAWAEAHAALGRSYYSQNRPRDAARSYEKALALKPDLLEPHYALCHVYYSLGEWKASQKQLNVLRGMNPQLAAKVERELPPPDAFRSSGGFAGYLRRP